jgi:hypothetical protein
MPCETLANLCPTCLDLASKCSDKLEAEYIPVNSLRQPTNTKPFIMEFDTATLFHTHGGGELIGESLRNLIEPNLKTTGDDGTPHVRRFHMWIRQYTEAEAERARTNNSNARPVPVIKVSLLIDLPKVSMRRDVKLLSDIWFTMTTRMIDPTGGSEITFIPRQPELYDEEAHDSLYRLKWFDELVRNQPCAPYMVWTNLAPLLWSETRPANARVQLWFIWRAQHPTVSVEKVAGA